MSAPAAGLLGGSFDPVHLGHLAMGRLALDLLGFAEVHFVPSSRPPHKTRRALTDSHHRYAMLALATLEEPRFRVSLEELKRSGHSYTIDTLRRLRASAGGLRSWCFLVGADAFAEIDTWKSARSVLDAVEFVVFPRDGIGFADLRRRLPAWVRRRLIMHHPGNGLPAPGGPPRVRWVPLETPRVSSTEVRLRAARGQDLSELVPPLVAHYIARYGLYRGRGGRAR